MYQDIHNREVDNRRMGDIHRDSNGSRKTGESSEGQTQVGQGEER